MVCDLGSPLRSWENEEEPTKNIEKTDEENQENRES